ncbi:MAG: tRNA (adenine22-N1)-methyltransferase, partial [Thermoproteota archaeon]
MIKNTANHTIISYNGGMKFKPKMGKRLSYLYNLIPSDGDAFYDLCCDHGQIALNVLKFKNYKYVVANDQVPSIIESLSKYIGTYIPQELRSKITVELKSAAEIKPKQDAVFLIAGVGGDTALQIVEAILNSTEFKAEFIISAHKNLIKLRAALNQFGCNFM